MYKGKDPYSPSPILVVFMPSAHPGPDWACRVRRNDLAVQLVIGAALNAVVANLPASLDNLRDEY